MEPTVLDRGLGTWRYIKEQSSYESGPGPGQSQRRWVAAGDGAVTFKHDYTTADGEEAHVEFTAKYGACSTRTCLIQA
jgi:hypothetical protein